ncbi:glycosyltransferase family 20-domain-containing protein [Lentinula aciculospora]|uniref:Glycosyltransferase family 20-domain-containing protein n=1 Tax=Lentinula aciculospora TaxID=153920 RepID=A0A9W9DWU7_9AGAR|nr:glycosyltransferase family 20-domain-containing protein [Lentinula aciculospora]
MASSSSLRNHRILVAALFLPHTAVLGPDPAEERVLSIDYPSENDEATTPVELGTTSEDISAPELAHGFQNETTISTILTPSGSITPSVVPSGHPLSIVEDLRDRAAAGKERPGASRQSNHTLLGRVATPGSPTHEVIHPFRTPGGNLPGAKAIEAKPVKKFSLTLPGTGNHPSPLSQRTAPDEAKEPSFASAYSSSSSSHSSRSFTVAHAAALKRNLSRQRNKNIVSPKRSSPHSARHTSSTSTASITSLASASSVASLDSWDSIDSPLDEEVEEGEEKFHVGLNPHVNGGLKNAIESVSAAMMQGFAPQAASAPPSKSSFPLSNFVPRHSRNVSSTSVSAAYGQSSEFSRLWIGCLGTKTDDWSQKLRERVEEALPRQEGGAELPVWVEYGDFEGCYDEFCHQVLWPALHYAVPDAPKTRLFYESASYKQYVSVNWAFARRIGEVWKEGDIVWVNDYHLMLVPLMLRSSGLIPNTAPIGFFLHVAFPSSEIFRCLSVREHLLKGILGADLVGFQTANYARHFRQTCGRVLGVETLPSGIVIVDDENSGGSSDDRPDSPSYVRQKQLSNPTAGRLDALGKGRLVDVGVFPMGIDVARLDEWREEPEVADWIAMLTEKYQGMKLVVGRDKLDDIQGVYQKMQAFDVFLTKHPEWVGKVVLIQLAIPNSQPHSSTSHSSVSTSNLDSDSGDITSAIMTTVSHINSQFSTLTYQPVVLLHTQDVDFSQYLALLSVADVFLVTSLREGMALRTHEFVCCQSGRADELVFGNEGTMPNGESASDRKGVLVLSEFTGSYSYSGFRSCIAINPWDARGTAEAINTALYMPRAEARTRWEELHNHVIAQTAQAFVANFLSRCLRANGEHICHKDTERAGAVRVLDEKAIVEKWSGQTQGKKLILVDWEGTLVGDYLPAGASGATSEREVQKEQEFKTAITVLKKLVAQEEKNEVWLLSGLPIKVLERISKEVGGRIGIVAENGCFLKTIEPSVAGGTGTWITMVANFNMTWKSSCLEILNYFSERTPGSFVEEREASVVWRFWTGPSEDSADHQWARRQAAEAQNHIFDSLGERYGLRIIPGANSFLVLPTKISRSTAVGAILNPDGPAQSPFAGARPWMAATESEVVPSSAQIGEKWDCILGLSSDENLLRRLAELSIAETCSTSGKGTDASWKIERAGVVPFLESLTEDQCINVRVCGDTV